MDELYVEEIEKQSRDAPNEYDYLDWLYQQMKSVDNDNIKQTINNSLKNN